MAILKDLDYPVDQAPDAGQPVKVADGVYWLRLPLPFALNHINVWLLEDGEGWAVIDTGIKAESVQEVWEDVLSGFMGARPVTQVIITHMHPDHVGLAGWLTRRFNCPFWMTRTEYFSCRMLIGDTGREAPADGVTFYRAAGFNDEQVERYRTRFGMFGLGVYQMPDSYHRMRHGSVLMIGGREWRVVTGGGHSPEHASLHCADLDVLISGDQVLPTITSNISVWPTEPLGDPLGEWLAACEMIKREVPDSVLVLPSHQKIFRNLHTRCNQLIEGHETHLHDLHALLKTPHRAVDVFPVLFRRAITKELVNMAVGEAVAHLNYLLARGRITVSRDSDGVDWYVQA